MFQDKLCHVSSNILSSCETYLEAGAHYFEMQGT